MFILKTYIFILGLIMGSFLNVCIYRIPRGESISFPPSHCTNCGNRIKWYDLVPVFSYLILKGKCRYCGERISYRYPLIELTTGGLFLALYIKFGLGMNFVKFTILICFLLVIGVIDLDTTDVYSKTTYSGIAFGIILLTVNFIYFSGGALDFLIGGATGFSVIALIILLTNGMGWGDAEICGMCGLFLGWRLTVFMLFISFILGGLIGIILLITKKKSRKDYIPFGPYISIAAAVSIFIGSSAIVWYSGIL